MIQTSINEIPLLKFESLPQNGRLQQAVFTRRGGISLAPFDTLNLSISVADDVSHVMDNRALAYGTHDRSMDSLVHAHLIHDDGVAQVTDHDYGRYVGPVDGLITDQPGCGLTMNYADCAPIILYDPVNHAIGLGHSGWQGTVKDLPGSMVRTMVKAFGSAPGQLLAAIGPCIGPCCYEVGERVISAVQQAFENSDSLLQASTSIHNDPVDQDHAYFDLPNANRDQLRRNGVETIEVTNLCTSCRTDLFFSHRAEKGQTGRFGALLILE